MMVRAIFISRDPWVGRTDKKTSNVRFGTEFWAYYFRF